MALASWLIAWSRRFSATTYALVVDVDNTGAETLTFPTSATTLDPTTDYYMTGDEDAVDLCEMLEVCIEQYAGLSITVDVTINSSWQIEVDVASGGTNIDIQWDNGSTTLDKSIWGFTATTGDQDPATSTNLPQGIWRPQRPASFDSRDRQPVIGGLASALSGRHRVSNFGTPFKERDISFSLLPQARVLDEYAAATEPTGAFEHAWVNSMSLGYSFRLYEDEDTIGNGSSAYTTYRIASLDEPHVRSAQYPVFWDVQIPMRRTS